MAVSVEIGGKGEEEGERVYMGGWVKYGGVLFRRYEWDEGVSDIVVSFLSKTN